MNEEFFPVILAFLALMGLIAIRVPIGLSLIAVSFVGIAFETSMRGAIGSVSRLPYELATNWTFSAVPMFLLMGFVASETGLTRGLFSATRVLLSRLPGALACSSVVASALFAAASGSSVATASAMSRIAIPEMLRRKYDPGLACGAVAASGTLGSLIPPSILMILYGVYADVSIGKLFLAGVVPGLLSVGLYMAMIVVRCGINPKLAGDQDVSEEAKMSAWQLCAELAPLPLLIAIVMGSISFGLATPTEAGALGAFGAVFIAVITRRFTFDGFLSALRQSALSFTAIFIIVIGGALLTRYVAIAGLSRGLSDLMEGAQLGPIGLIVIVALIYVVLGMFIDSIGLLLLTAPLILPLAVQADMDMIWFGIILIKLLEIGLITPPVGLNVFVIQSSLKGAVAMPVVFKGVTWFIAMDLAALVLLVAFPLLSTALPELMR
ncbi:TRAP transporter large permease [Hoeflea prorocentri]|uniref:TRAP transporter large permease protein n=1 Tax=Hoeflea prorocentri TaxID=1922333 RepID=A0A9X3ZI94_9HYPH|nr:TRAP transporter large permease [Hoeflea prorocentri]MCY6382199.1 TRAP transporter large permease [Hoeflea prorocentri]MDA5399999.1 TRAP transporter large permease [Hoeflea prorocentri]